MELSDWVRAHKNLRKLDDRALELREQRTPAEPDVFGLMDEYVAEVERMGLRGPFKRLDELPYDELPAVLQVYIRCVRMLARAEIRRLSGGALP